MSALFRIVRQFATATNSLGAWYNKIPQQVKKEIPLLNTLQRFSDSLPVREIDCKIYNLHELNMWVHDDDIGIMADELERASQSRFAVKYLAAPTAYGKSSFPLRAFLKSSLRKPKQRDPIQHYIYLAFSNNNTKYYKFVNSPTSNDPFTAFERGAEFMLRCLADVINEDPSRQTRRISCDDKPANFEATVAAMHEIFVKFKGQVLVHTDEHRSMCDHAMQPLTRARFSEGAMSALAQAGFTVLATYLQLPPVPAAHSGTCREPVSVPPLDVDAAMADVEEFEKLQRKVKGAKLNADQERMWASLRFRLALKLRELNLGIVQVRGNTFTDFLARFEVEASKPTLTEALKGCCSLCTIKPNQPTLNENASKLLKGVSDVMDEDFHRQVGKPLVVYNGLVTCELEALLEMKDPNNPVYTTGRDLMQNFLTALDSDLLANRPLELAYFWALSTQASLSGVLNFGNKQHGFECRKLLPGRIFPSDDPSKSANWIRKIKPGHFFYVDEGHGKPTHPFFDWWFMDADGCIVLGDVTGGSGEQMKASNMGAWIQSQQKNHRKALYGVVLAPNASGDTELSSTNRNVTIVRGPDAIKLLGGLGQVFRWMSPREVDLANEGPKVDGQEVGAHKNGF